MPPELLQWLKKLDDWCISAATKNSTMLFKTQRSEAEVGGMYVSLVKAGRGRVRAYAPL